MNSKGEIQRVYVQMQAMIKGPDGKPIKTSVTSMENGTYEILCTPPRLATLVDYTIFGSFSSYFLFL